jgi:hypothetical protein
VFSALLTGLFKLKKRFLGYPSVMYYPPNQTILQVKNNNFLNFFALLTGFYKLKNRLVGHPSVTRFSHISGNLFLLISFSPDFPSSA